MVAYPLVPPCFLYMATSNVIVSRTGTGFTIDVTACNLSTDTSIKDFVVLHNGVNVSVASYAKTTYTTLTYSGSSLPASTTVEVRRKTPNNFLQSITSFPTRLSSAAWNAAFDWVLRHYEEYDLNGSGSPVTVATPKDDAYGVVWDGDTVYPPTRNSVYDKIETLAPKNDPTLTGNVIVPSQVKTDNSTKAANTAYVKDNLADYLTTVNAGNTYTTKAGFRPVFIAERTTDQTLSGGDNRLVFNSEVVDTDGAYNNTTGVFTVPVGKAGVYLLCANATVIASAASNGAVTGYSWFRKNGSVVIGQIGNQVYPSATGVALNGSGSRLVFLNDNDTVDVMFFILHSAASPTYILNSPDLPSFSAFRIQY